MRRHAYFQLNLAHLLGLVLLVGGIGAVDLRVLGVGRRVPVAELSRVLTPFAIVGLVLMLASGALMFAADAKGLVASGLFQAKVALIALGVANALVFRRLFGELRSGAVPPAAQAMAGFSLCLWLSAAVLGRWIGYV